MATRRVIRRWSHLNNAWRSSPPITVPTIVLHGACDGVGPPEQSENHARHFTGRYERRVVPVAGHFLSRETPDAVVQAVRDLLA